MDLEAVTKIATASIAGLGALAGFFQLLTTRRSQSYQNYKTELELLRQPTDSPNADPDFERFLVNVRKEKISFVAFGMPIPNAELDRVIAYYGKGKATTRDITKAWPYRNPKKEELSFELTGPAKFTLWMIRGYVILCLLLIFAVIVVAATVASSTQEFATLGIAGVVLYFVAILAGRSNEGLFIADRLAKKEKESSKTE
jgi:hypothetical protein